ncbi:MAG: hypothetical protein JSV03_17200 [Planctomycetota bacterium]|nr:MAG: hypothetical protein JSV03_17200 [Planctomycetota bacterium]
MWSSFPIWTNFGGRLGIDRRMGVLFGVLLATAICGCVLPPFTDVLVSNGQSIRMTTIVQIVANPELSEEAKKQQLRDLGILDEDLIDLLVRELGQ